ncbi:MAG: monofunctional biosynthetic peptidoglycan transglycosylase [Hydrotalea flava]|uniref:monofunctional biosynthetic peptidoglycan transglycosylase n=1 Tax=Hydrotalea sp. AMD TaxID=2501297 RepID=UPI000943D119|nr:monofunctional biosynthetic peptidoglycan transglycosylase [Hydrotalea sp. AMD]NIM34680.1 monofunctional biosynthetic peptidoglycan transglycosylase [Hydrotalea flava]NIM37515.1 monofunctional biosynthetic peptidoglycan transglycosylase [Hydrotalea flava]NIN02497.1 monofunctional biosynthetic peptidoglycan transglycosylase [Hydrotalea flava]NIN14358.1 monofunctional biosynthetic peptidoglycan transglycosylase [Hydrotalea flava]NIO93441.1 monofunctional biosynthetic peptidoglycan transglycos
MAANKLISKCWKWTTRVVLFLFLSSLLYVIACKWIMPPITLTQLGNVFSYGLKRDYISWNNISYNAKLAAIASEDQSFADHNGFDWDAIQKSLHPKKKKKTRIPLGGAASTISQQTAKNVFLWQGSGFSKYLRKGLEFYFTFLIEKIWGKQRILDVYLNTIEMGPGIFGIEAAAQQYFHKPAKNLTRTEAAMIIACLPNPKKFTVVPMSTRVAWRYPQIVQQMRNIEDDADIQKIIQ